MAAHKSLKDCVAVITYDKGHTMSAYAFKHRQPALVLVNDLDQNKYSLYR